MNTGLRSSRFGRTKTRHQPTVWERRQGSETMNFPSKRWPGGSRSREYPKSDRKKDGGILTKGRGKCGCPRCAATGRKKSKKKHRDLKYRVGTVKKTRKAGNHGEGLLMKKRQRGVKMFTGRDEEGPEEQKKGGFSCEVHP